MTGSLKARLYHFTVEDEGATVLETLVVFMPILTLVYANIEVILGFYTVNAAEKAAQAASRIAATQSPIYIGSDLWDASQDQVARNQLNPLYVDDGPACFQPNGVPGCVAPNDAGWVCNGSSVDTDPNCDSDRFGLLVTELQRFYPAVRCTDVTITYIYRQLGVAGGPIVPEIQVAVAPRELPVNLPSLLGFATIGDDEGFGLGASVSSTLGEDMANPPGMTLPTYRCTTPLGG
ncbi:MAG: hypothetical protein AAF677_02140 [Pseudomonadota bacterium]